MATKPPEPKRLIEMRIESTPVAFTRDYPGMLIIELAGIRTEVNYRRCSSALAAAKRIAKAFKLVKRAGRHEWRSKT